MNTKSIRSLRKGAGMTQEELAGKLGVTVNTVSRWEKGWFIPSPKYIKQMADMFGVDGSDIYVASYATKVDNAQKA